MLMQANSYWAHLVKWGLDKTKGDADKGKEPNPFVFLTFEVTHYAEAGAWKPLPRPKNRDVKLFVSDAAWEWTEKKLRALGFNGKWDETMDFAAEFKENGVELSCDHEDGYGANAHKQYERWDLANWGPAKQRAAVANDVISQLEARWRNSNPTPKAAAPAGQPAAPARQPVATEQPGADEKGETGPEAYDGNPADTGTGTETAGLPPTPDDGIPI